MRPSRGTAIAVLGEVVGEAARGEGGAWSASDAGQLRGLAVVVVGADGLTALAGVAGVADDPLSPLDDPLEDPFDDDSDDDPLEDPFDDPFDDPESPELDPDDPESPELDPDDGAAAPAVLAADLADPPRLSVL